MSSRVLAWQFLHILEMESARFAITESEKKKRVPISSLKTLLSQKLASFLEMKRATRLSHKAVHDMKPASRIHIIQLWQKNQEEIWITPDIFGVKEKSFV